MSHAALEIAQGSEECIVICGANHFFEGGINIPFLVFFDKDIMLTVEFLDVKRVPWPEPGPGVSST